MCIFYASSAPLKYTFKNDNLELFVKAVFPTQGMYF